MPVVLGVLEDEIATDDAAGARSTEWIFHFNNVTHLGGSEMMRSHTASSAFLGFKLVGVMGARLQTHQTNADVRESLHHFAYWSSFDRVGMEDDAV